MINKSLVSLLFEKNEPELKTGMNVYARKKTSSGTWMTIKGIIVDLDKINRKVKINKTNGNSNTNYDYWVDWNQVKIIK